MRRYEHKKPTPFATFFKATLGVLLAGVAALTIFAGGCCGLVVGAASSVDAKEK